MKEKQCRDSYTPFALFARSKIKIETHRLSYHFTYVRSGTTTILSSMVFHWKLLTLLCLFQVCKM